MLLLGVVLSHVPTPDPRGAGCCPYRTAALALEVPCTMRGMRDIKPAPGKRRPGDGAAPLATDDSAVLSAAKLLLLDMWREWLFAMRRPAAELPSRDATPRCARVSSEGTSLGGPALSRLSTCAWDYALGPR